MLYFLKRCGIRATKPELGEDFARVAAGGFGLKDLQKLPALKEFAELRERYEQNLPPPASVLTGSRAFPALPGQEISPRAQPGWHAPTSVAATFASGRINPVGSH